MSTPDIVFLIVNSMLLAGHVFAVVVVEERLPRLIALIGYTLSLFVILSVVFG